MRYKVEGELYVKTNYIYYSCIIFLIFLIITIPLQVGGADAPDWQYDETEHFVIRHHGLNEETVHDVAEAAEKAYDKVSGDLDYYIQNKTIIQICSSEEEFIGERASASYIFFMNTIYIKSPELRYLEHHEDYEQWLGELEENMMHCFESLQIQFHRISRESVSRRKAIQEKLMKTHDVIWEYPFVWENWERRES